MCCELDITDLRVQVKLSVYMSRHSKSNPIELNFNRTQSNEIELTEKKKIHRTQSNVLNGEADNNT